MPNIYWIFDITGSWYAPSLWEVMAIHKGAEYAKKHPNSKFIILKVIKQGEDYINMYLDLYRKNPQGLRKWIIKELKEKGVLQKERVYTAKEIIEMSESLSRR